MNGHPILTCQATTRHEPNARIQAGHQASDECENGNAGKVPRFEPSDCKVGKTLEVWLLRFGGFIEWRWFKDRWRFTGMLRQNLGQPMGIGDVPKGSVLQFKISSKFQSLINSPPLHSRGNLSFKIEWSWLNFDFPAIYMTLVNPTGAFSALG